MSKINKNKYMKLFEVVKNAVDEWNPYQLLPEAPANEFDDESAMILAQIKKDSDVDEIATIVSRVFSKAFESQYFCKESCLDVAREIKSNIEKIL